MPVSSVDRVDSGAVGVHRVHVAVAPSRSLVNAIRVPSGDQSGAAVRPNAVVSSGGPSRRAVGLHRVDVDGCPANASKLLRTRSARRPATRRAPRVAARRSVRRSRVRAVDFITRSRMSSPPGHCTRRCCVPSGGPGRGVSRAPDCVGRGRCVAGPVGVHVRRTSARAREREVRSPSGDHAAGDRAAGCPRGACGRSPSGSIVNACAWAGRAGSRTAMLDERDPAVLARERGLRGRQRASAGNEQPPTAATSPHADADS